MSIEHKRKIDWTRTSLHVAQLVWGLGTYIALMVGIAWVAVHVGGDSKGSIAFFSALGSAWLNWMVFMGVERKYGN